MYIYYKYTFSGGLISMVYILNFNVSRELQDLEDYFDNDGKTNIDYILDDFEGGTTEWSVPKSASPGDTAVFMCAVSAKSNIGMAISHIPTTYGQDFQAFAAKEKALYKQYSGYILGYGVVYSNPEYDDADRRWYSDINQLFKFPNPIFFDEFKSFIYISRTNSITYLKDDQWERLKWLVNKSNPGVFRDVNAPYAETLEQEYKSNVAAEEKKSFDQLKKEANKKASQPTVDTVRTKIYHRDPTISAFVKKRANGYCQLCGSKAPFIDKNGAPYLECHHIDWLSNGGMDSIDNCVALCPNCHRKMHNVNDPNDIKLLKSKINSNTKVK